MHVGENKDLTTNPLSWSVVPVGAHAAKQIRLATSRTQAFAQLGREQRARIDSMQTCSLRPRHCRPANACIGMRMHAEAPLESNLSAGASHPQNTAFPIHTWNVAPSVSC